MAQKKTTVKGEKKYWVVTDDNQYQEVDHDDLMKNPMDYVGKKIFDKPPFKYELVVSLKRTKND
ncbi:MAG: hypothetical protein K8S56_02895 [Candidatus Cloacimonetes bacterium]|nr:hypothetical protein [Candidatus Cloacimonadota bacterium]